MQEALTCGLPVETLSNTFLFKGARQVIYTDCLVFWSGSTALSSYNTSLQQSGSI